MTGRILGMNQEVFTFPELHFFEEIWAEKDRAQPMTLEDVKQTLIELFSAQRDGYFKKTQNPKYLIDADKLIHENNIGEGTHLKHEVFALFARYEAHLNRKTRWCEQTPRNVFYIDTIHELFPEARFVQIVRDPRDVLLSQKNRWKRRKLEKNKRPWRVTFREWLNYHPITMMKLWVSASKRVGRHTDMPYYMSIRYEDLLAEPNKTLSQVCAFLGLEYQSTMVEVPQVGSSLKNDEPGRKGLNASKVSGWKKGGLTQAETYICERIGGRCCSALGASETSGKAYVDVYDQYHVYKER